MFTYPIDILLPIDDNWGFNRTHVTAADWHAWTGRVQSNDDDDDTLRLIFTVARNACAQTPTNQQLAVYVWQKCARAIGRSMLF